MNDFASFGLSAELLRGIQDLGFVEPTPIQIQAIPPAMAGRDVLACAMTGSGKTAAFLLPILQRFGGRPSGTTRALVLTPTRELAAQIAEHLVGFAAHTRVTGAAVFGGVASGPQESAFRRGVDVLVATPGRLLDHFQNDYARLDDLEVLVLDEADRMLDMGFLPDVRRVLAALPRERQTMLFSATLPPPIVELAQEMLRDPVAINVERRAQPADGVEQAVYAVREDLKPWLLLELLRRDEIKNVLVFTRTKHRANRLAEFLDRQKMPCDRIHGNRSQAQRTDALARFKSGRLRVLIATDIAARGIDVEALSHVINFDVPNVPDDYIHRVGRTARAGAVGDAFTFVAPQEQADWHAIERAVGKRLPQRTLAGFDYAAASGERLEIPLAERIAAIRARKAEERARAREKAARKVQREQQPAAAPVPGSPQPAISGGRGGRRAAGSGGPGGPAGHSPNHRGRDDGQPRAPRHGGGSGAGAYGGAPGAGAGGYGARGSRGGHAGPAGNAGGAGHGRSSGRPARPGNGGAPVGRQGGRHQPAAAQGGSHGRPGGRREFRPAAPIGPMAPSTRMPSILSGGTRDAGREARPDLELEGRQPIDPRQPPVEVDRLGDTEARAAKAASLFRPRFSTRWSK
ncbi:MAG TPA: DEAD/DEAH box helicase [Thermoanaerobaculia bacterium]|nr:DEAD/DEAH box helicase [Thermoanaerobaculia bacterium]